MLSMCLGVFWEVSGIAFGLGNTLVLAYMFAWNSIERLIEAIKRWTIMLEIQFSIVNPDHLRVTFVWVYRIN